MTGTDLETYRKALGWDRRQLGEWLGLASGSAHAQVWRWERGRRRVPKWVALALDLFDAWTAAS